MCVCLKVLTSVWNLATHSKFQSATKTVIPIYSMYGIFTIIYLKNDPHAGKYTIHGAYGMIEFNNLLR